MTLCYVSVFFPTSLMALCVYVRVWVLVHVSYLQTCLPVCLGRGNHYAYYAYRHHEGKNPQHLPLCLLPMLMELLLGPQQILRYWLEIPSFLPQFFIFVLGVLWHDYKRDSFLLNTDCKSGASESHITIIASFSFVFPAKLNGLFNKLFHFKSALL